MVPASLRRQLYRALKPWANRLYLWLQGGSTRPGRTPAAVTPRRVITTLAELDAELNRAQAAAATSNAAFIEVLSSFDYLHPVEYPADPYSDAYREAQMRAYLEISGRTRYKPVENEHTVLDLDAAKRVPHPYSSRDTGVIGDQLIAQGILMRALALPAGATIVEYGAGSGMLTLTLALSGYAVTAVKVQPHLGEIIRHRAAQLGLDIPVSIYPMLEFRPPDPVDCALFFESFHHCDDHLRLLRLLEEVVKPDGQLVFAMEPITAFAHPWGMVRTDGVTTWCIRRFGWLELGFDTSYFVRTLLSFGWAPRQFASADLPIATVFVARRANRRYDLSQLALPPDEALGWGVSGPVGRSLTGGPAMFSCHRHLSVGSVTLCLSNSASERVTLSVTAGSRSSTQELAPGASHVQVVCPAQNWTGQIRLDGPRQAGLTVHWILLNDQGSPD